MDAQDIKKITNMQQGGAFAAELRELLVSVASPGMKTSELENIAAEYYSSHSITPSFLGYMGYPFHIITCINEEVVHGMPSDKVIEKGDVLTVDLGVYLKGYHTDTATSVEIGTNEWSDFLQVGREALLSAIRVAIKGNYVGDISHAMQEVVESAGYNVIRAFVGHGIGKNMHEDIQIPCFGEPGSGEQLYSGMTIAIEVMYTEGSYNIVILDDGWTAVTRDGKRSAMFEHTVAVTDKGPLILTDSSARIRNEHG